MLQSDRRNLSMMMDFYEMTMGYGYFRSQKPCNRVIFDFFYRQNPDNGGYAIFAGLEQIIDYQPPLRGRGHRLLPLPRLL